MNNIEEDYKLFQLVKRNPIKNCIDLSKNMTGKRNGLFYFTKSFRIDFENKMCDLERLKAEHEEDKKKIEEIQKIAEEKEKNKLEEKEPEEVSQNTMNFKHQKALDDFYNYAEEIKQDVVEKKVKTKGKHSK